MANKPVQVEGTWYSSIAQACRVYGRTVDQVQHRMKDHGMSLLEALQTKNRFTDAVKNIEYGSWRAMLGRCYEPRSNGYDRYGAKGITVCDRWRESFWNFLEDMGPKPTPKHQIDRINNDLGYSKDNCRWATHMEQTKNKRPWIPFNSKKTHCMRGHAFNAENTYLNRRGGRVCRTCMREHDRNFKAKMKATRCFA